MLQARLYQLSQLLIGFGFQNTGIVLLSQELVKQLNKLFVGIQQMEKTFLFFLGSLPGEVLINELYRSLFFHYL